MNLTVDKLEKEKKQLVEQREQTIAGLQQLTGAIAMIEKLIKELSEEKSIEETELKQAA